MTAVSDLVSLGLHVMALARERQFPRLAAAALSLLIVSGLATEARADARTQARRAFRSGMRKIAAKRYEEGITALEKANAILPHPNVQFNIAQAYLSLGQDAKALEWLDIYLSQPIPPGSGDLGRRQAEEIRTRMAARRPPPPPIPMGDAPIPPGAPVDTADVERLRSLAQVLKPLARERAIELAELADRLESGASIAPLRPAVQPDPPPPPLIRNPKPSKQPDETELRGVEEYQEQKVVTAATRQKARPADAPAVVWVITQEDIRTRGYESIAEALRAVPGLHIIDDHVFIDVGVRGVHSSLRGMSRLIKVLIDGHPVAFRPTGGSFLGPEAIPMRAVDRIELIRGPASALYGANAFLGVLQIVTRKGGDVGGGAITGRAGITTSTERVDGTGNANAYGSLDAIVGTQEDNLAIFLSAQAGVLNRSGLRLPRTSPFNEELTALRGGVSLDDFSRPASFFGSLSYNIGTKGQLTLSGGVQRLEANGEWLDYGALTHFTLVSLTNAWIRLSYELPVNEQLTIRAFTSYADASPNENHRIRPLIGFTLTPDETRHFVEDYRSQAVFSGFEMQVDLPDQKLGLRIGADLDLDSQNLTRAQSVFDEEGAGQRPGDSIEIARSSVDETTLTNAGFYLQLSAHPVEVLDIIGGIRYDFQSLYGSNLNGRLGTVVRASDWLFFKALYGSSFRAPAADQLFRRPAYIGDAAGCRDYVPCAAVDLKPQIAHTGELVAGLSFSESFTAQVTGYVSFVDDLIILFPNSANAFVTTNAGQRLSTGVEFESAVRLIDLEPGFDFRAHLSIALQRTSSDIPQSLFDPAESIRAEYREASLYPNATVSGGLDLSYRPANLGLYLEGRFVGSRRASGSNLALSLGFSNYEGDALEQLPAYFELDANLSTRDLYILPSGETVLSLRVTDILGVAHAEGGFRGWDVPTIGRTVTVRLSQEF